MQAKIERADEYCGKTAYKPVAKAITIAPMPSMERRRAQTKCFLTTSSSLCIVIKKWKNTADAENTMAIVSVVTKALKVVFFVKIAVPSPSL